MSESFYRLDDRKKLLSHETHKWIGTPFRYGSAVPGILGGVDCVMLTATLHVACGASEPVLIKKRLPLTWHLHHSDSGIVEFLRAPGIRERLRQVDRDDPPMHGDIVAIKTQLCVHHLTTWLDDALGQHVIHVPINGTVQRWSLNDRALRGKVAGIWRIMEV